MQLHIVNCSQHQQWLCFEYFKLLKLWAYKIHDVFRARGYGWNGPLDISFQQKCKQNRSSAELRRRFVSNYFVVLEKLLWQMIPSSSPLAAWGAVKVSCAIRLDSTRPGPDPTDRQMRHVTHLGSSIAGNCVSGWRLRNCDRDDQTTHHSEIKTGPIVLEGFVRDSLGLNFLLLSWDYPSPRLIRWQRIETGIQL